MTRFLGKTALVTGSGTGIGKAIVTAFVQQGASVIILGRRSEPLEQAAAELRDIISENGSGANVRIFADTDVSSQDKIDAMFDALRHDGVTVDYVINNAGVSGPVTCFSNAPMDEFTGTVDIHLTGTYWVSMAALPCMKKGGKIITISTFFTEERPLEQRPYRFRGPYTASQGAKNRLAEALSWELVDDGIASIATNPGPVHSDRIYKTVYPRAAAEFMRVGGFEGLTPVQVEAATSDILPLLGEDDKAIQDGLDKAAAKFDYPDIRDILERLLTKIQVIAEKVQRNTSHMISDRQFLSQDQVAHTVLNLCEDSTSAILNGRVVPGDRVFYPVRPHVTTMPPSAAAKYDAVAIIADIRLPSDSARISHLANHISEAGGRVALFMPRDTPQNLQDSLGDIHSHLIDIYDAQQVRRWLETANTKLGPLSAVICMTGNFDDTALVGLTRSQWDAQVSKFIKMPAIVSQEALAHFVPGGGADPRKFAGAKGRVIIVGPSLPEGRKIPEKRRARTEIFRGALRPFATTINQELSDVLKSQARVFAILPGSVTGASADHAKLSGALDYLVTDAASASAEVIFCVDELRA